MSNLNSKITNINAIVIIEKLINIAKFSLYAGIEQHKYYCLILNNKYINKSK